MSNRLAARRAELGLTKTEAARRIGTSKQHYGRLEGGQTTLDAAWLQKIARAFRCRPIDLMPELAGDTSSAVLVGYVGAGEKVFNFEEGTAEEVEAPPGGLDVQAVRVRGESMWPAYRENDILYFEATTTIDVARCLYRDCVLQTVDGPTYVKRLIPGPTANTFTLTSYRAPEIPGVRVRWASPVLWVKRSK